MIVIYNYKGNIIEQTSDDSLWYKYVLFAEARKLSCIKINGDMFPEPGFKLDEAGNYRRLKLSEQNLNLPASQVIDKDNNGNEYIRTKTVQEQINEKIISLDFIKDQHISRLNAECNSYLNNAKTESGYTVNTDARTIVAATLGMIQIDDNDVYKQQLMSSGIIYPIDKAKEIISFLEKSMAAFKLAAADIKKQKTATGIEKIKFLDYL